jgi:uncharacterized protein YecE (DUF72 family)
MDLPGLQESAHAEVPTSKVAETRRRVSEKFPGIRIGTSGYSFPDWIGTYYPHGTPRGNMFDQYVQDFETVEINSTYYGIPHSRVFAAMEKKAPPGFDFIVKMHGSFTHERDQADANIPKLLEAVGPLNDSGRLSGLLAQFPYSFKYSAPSLDYIRDKNDRLQSIPLFVEFRHDSWLRPEVKDALRAERIGYSNVDEPQLPHLLPPESDATTSTGYIRLHGRNADKWWDGGAERYNYAYTDNQLREWVQRLESLRQKADRIYVFFNNCHLGRAVRDAHRLMELLTDDDA